MMLISIHAPHAGCDYSIEDAGEKLTISIHAPHAGCDAWCSDTIEKAKLFQSTHPMRGAT